MFTAAIARPYEAGLNGGGMGLVDGLVYCDIDTPCGDLDMPLTYSKG